jgi:glycosyltransferase involved in cell wall biosynthesis
MWVRSVPTVSAVIPTYNYSQFLGEAVESVLAQTSLVNEVVIVDDGSTDDTSKKYGQNSDAMIRWGSERPDVHIHYVRQENRGVSSARNAGVAIASSEYVAFLDADDRWFPEKIGRQLQVLCGEMQAAQTGFVAVGADGRSLQECPAPDRLSFEGALRLEPMLSLLSSSLLINRQHFLDIGGFDTQLSTSADFHLGLRLLRTGSLGSVSEPLVHYLVHPSGMHNNVRRFESDMRLALSKSTEDVDRSLRKDCERAFCLTLTKSYAGVGDYPRALKTAAKGIVRHPDLLAPTIRAAVARVRHGRQESIGPSRSA